MNLQDLNELNFSNIGDWPGLVKGFVILVVCGLVVGAGYYFDTQHQIADLERAEQEEVRLKKEFEKKQAKAANLEAYRQQLAEMKESFGTMLRQLPDKTEVAALLVDVSQTGLAAGLEFELFQPLGEIPREFYAELPIKLRVTGEYHEFGEFVSGLASLPRIVTIHDVVMQPKGDVMELQATAKTYRYIDEEAGK